jgi:hypothetical protein
MEFEATIKHRMHRKTIKVEAKDYVDAQLQAAQHGRVIAIKPAKKSDVAAQVEKALNEPPRTL